VPDQPIASGQASAAARSITAARSVGLAQPDWKSAAPKQGCFAW